MSRSFIAGSSSEIPQYAVQQSTNLRSWTTVTPTETVLAANGEVHTIQARVPSAGNALFLRVLISPPVP